jgi:nucleotide-binding universal stress UspA family protein
VKRFKNILLFLKGTGDQAILRRAAVLAETNQALLTVMDVIEELPRDMRMLMVAITPKELHGLILKERREYLERIVAPIGKKGVQVSVNVFIGTPFLEIIRLVLRQKHDLVIMAAKGRRGLKDQLFGSTSLHLMRKCPCPVWVMKSTWRERFHRILAAVDPVGGQGEENRLNFKIMDMATSLAEMEQSDLHIVHVWDFRDEHLLPVRSRMSSAPINQLANQTLARHKKCFDELVGNYPLNNLNHRLHFIKGEPAAQIIGLAAQHAIDLIVMGTVCRTGEAGFFIGNTAESVLQQVDCSVLSVKPEGFVSPVRLLKK